MKEKLVESLRNLALRDRINHELENQKLPTHQQYAWIGSHLCEEAADEIERLEATLSKFRERVEIAAGRCDCHTQNRYVRAPRDDLTEAIWLSRVEPDT